MVIVLVVRCEGRTGPVVGQFAIVNAPVFASLGIPLASLLSAFLGTNGVKFAGIEKRATVPTLG